MKNQEKWIQLFEEIAGRKPTPAEFMAGKASQFDFKQIKQISQGLSTDEIGQEPSSDLAEEIAPVPVPAEEPVAVSEVISTPQQVVTPPASDYTGVGTTSSFPSSRPSNKKWLLGVLAVGVAALAGYVYLDQTRGVDVAVDSFTTKVKDSNYADLAKSFTTDEVTWESKDVKEFLTYLEQKGIDVQTEVSQLKNEPTKVITDDKGNQLLALTKVSDIVGFFPSYEVVSFPLEYSVQTGVNGLTIDGKKLEANKEVSLGQRAFVGGQFDLSGDTDMGTIAVTLSGDLEQASNNKLLLNIQAVEKPFRIKLPIDSSTVKGLVIKVGSQEVKDTVDAKVKVLENQQVTLSARFDYEGASYQTEETTVAVQSGTGSQEVELTLSKDDLNKVKKAQEELEAKKKEESEKAAKFEAEKSKITSFMQEYIQVVDNSIRNHTVEFSHYHDTNAYFHKELVDFAHSQSNRVGRSREEFTVTDIKQEGADYIVYVRSRFTDHFRDGKSSSQNQSQTYLVRPNGSSYIIVDKDY